MLTPAARVLLILFAVMPHPGRAMDCTQAAAGAEQRYGLPAGLLLAIGLAESGRPNPRTAQPEPAPFSANVAGTEIDFASSAYALDGVAALRRRGVGSIDVGCFQINLLHHPHAFATLQDAFDPAANADYAASFLRRLFLSTGSWDAAVAAYHSADARRGGAYRDRVMRLWHGPGGVADAIPADRHVILLGAAATGIPVYTPATLPAALRAIMKLYIKL